MLPEERAARLKCGFKSHQRLISQDIYDPPTFLLGFFLCYSLARTRGPCTFGSACGVSVWVKQNVSGNVKLPSCEKRLSPLQGYRHTRYDFMGINL